MERPKPDRFSREAFSHVEEEVRRERSAGRSATSAGEQRHKEGKGLNPLVDPKGFGVIRRSISRQLPEGDEFVLKYGTAMLEETRWDTTGSMGGNVEIAFDVLPRSFKLTADVPNAPLKRYDVQMITSICQDVQDDYVLCRSQAEMDVRIAEQMRLMVPQRDGGDADEDHQYGIFGAAYLTNCTAVKFGLKTYDFTVTDARCRPFFDVETLTRVFGDEVFDRVQDNNGYQISPKSLPTTAEAVQELLKHAHAFLLLVNSSRGVEEFWTELYGRDRVVTLPRMELLPEVKVAIIGLTEGTQNLQNLESFLKEEAKLSVSDARSILRAVAHIPIGAQVALPNFKKIPLTGARFAKKGDLWPIGFDVEGNPVKDKGAEPKKKKDKKVWL